VAEAAVRIHALAAAMHLVLAVGGEYGPFRRRRIIEIPVAAVAATAAFICAQALNDEDTEKTERMTKSDLFMLQSAGGAD
jgi:hypothetical protein